LDENFVQLLNKNKTGKEIQLFKVYLKTHQEILKEMDNYYRNCFPFQDTLNNQHLICLEEVVSEP
jgi:hypothetical protein